MICHWVGCTERSWPQSYQRLAMYCCRSYPATGSCFWLARKCLSARHLMYACTMEQRCRALALGLWYLLRVLPHAPGFERTLTGVSVMVMKGQAPLSHAPEKCMISLNVRCNLNLAKHQQDVHLRRAALCRKSTPFPACSCMLVNLACAKSFLQARPDINTSVASRESSLPHRHTKPVCAPCLRCSSTTFDQRRASTPCPICSGSTQVPCNACKSSGRLTKSGYHAKNPVNVAKIVGNLS